MARAKVAPALPKGESLKRVVQRESPSTGRVLWSFDIVDHGGPWCLGKATRGELDLIYQKIRDYSRLTWGEIEADRKRDHCHEIHELAKTAKERLEAIRQDDIGVLWRLRFGGTERLWGKRENAIFKVLWWDPWHQVYPLEQAPAGDPGYIPDYVPLSETESIHNKLRHAEYHIRCQRKAIDALESQCISHLESIDQLRKEVARNSVP